MTQISFIAAFIAGMVALFAPCCISYLLPAYLGNIFREKKQILFMTVVYSLGIFVVMLPVVIGAKALSMLFFQLHDYTYIVGGVFMLFVGTLAFLGVKLPMPHIALTQNGQKTDVVSTFTLGVFSGITSACCAPVLIGVITLSTLSSSLLNAVTVGALYVLGMVSPLYIASFFVDKGNILARPVLKKKVGEIKLMERSFTIIVSNAVSGAVFWVTGALMLILTYSGKLGMAQAEDGVTESIKSVAEKISNLTGSYPLVNVLFVFAVMYLFYKFVRQGLEKFSANRNGGKHECCE